MNVQVYLVHPDGSGLRRLTDGGKETNRLGFWTYDGKSLAIGSNRRKEDAIDAYLMEPETGSLKLVVETKGTSDLRRTPC